MSEPVCKLIWKKNFYSEATLKACDYGCHSPESFDHATEDGVYGAWVGEGCCELHGVVISRLGGIMVPGNRHPCGAVIKEADKEEGVKIESLPPMNPDMKDLWDFVNTNELAKSIYLEAQNKVVRVLKELKRFADEKERKDKLG